MGFKTFDFFQKVSMDNVTKPTMIGSILSITAISIMIFLFFRQLMDFYSYHTKTNSIVFQPKNSDEQISINMNFVFNSVPCNLLSLDTVDAMNNHKGDIGGQLTKYKYDPASDKIKEKYNTDRSLNGLVNAINKNEGCAFVGKMSVSQVPGEFHISFHNYRNLWQQLNQNQKELAKKVKLSHSIKSLSFGETTESKAKQFELNTDLFFRDFESSNTFNDQELSNYNYFVKIIPYMLVDENRGRTDYAYSFSLSSKRTIFNPHYDDQPIVQIKYEFSPIIMEVTHLRRDYLHFLTHVSAIIGGVFVVFSLFNRVITGLMANMEK